MVTVVIVVSGAIITARVGNNCRRRDTTRQMLMMIELIV